MVSVAKLDPAIRRALPVGSKVVDVVRHGNTNWADGFKISIEVKGKRQDFFVKMTDRENALAMALGEYEGLKAMKLAIPSNAAAPIAYGPLDGFFPDETSGSQAFFMCEFRDLEQVKPSATVVADLLTKLHSNSVSPTGKFGFPVTTFKGYIPVHNGWCDTWEEWFTRQFREDVHAEQAMRGPDPEMDELLGQFLTKVVPRLLRPLETEGRSIRPGLCHTDIWHGNIHFDRSVGEFLIFDAACVYGHHEIELGMFLSEGYGWTAEYLEEYKKALPPSEPMEDFEDRIALYAVRNSIVSAAMWDDWAHMRQV